MYSRCRFRNAIWYNNPIYVKYVFNQVQKLNISNNAHFQTTWGRSEHIHVLHQM
jgi:hypothetical protein